MSAAFLTDLFLVLLAVPFAALGGNAFLQGVLGIAAALRVPGFLVATTFAAFATSSPELVVSTVAALSGKPEIGLGDALGSNVVNTALILGIALTSGRLAARLGDFRRDFAWAAGAPILTFALALDGTLSRADGVVLLALFLCWLLLVSREALDHRRRTQPDLPVAPHRAWFSALAGLASLLVAGQLFVTGAGGIAGALGYAPYVIGASIVAIGTSVPELVSTVLSRRRGHDDLGLGIILGSNLFNGLGIAGLAVTVHAATPPVRELAVTLAFGMLAVLLIMPRDGGISRRRGVILIACYATYVVTTLAL